MSLFSWLRSTRSLRNYSNPKRPPNAPERFPIAIGFLLLFSVVVLCALFWPNAQEALTRLLPIVSLIIGHYFPYRTRSAQKSSVTRSERRMIAISLLVVFNIVTLSTLFSARGEPTLTKLLPLIGFIIGYYFRQK